MNCNYACSRLVYFIRCGTPLQSKIPILQYNDSVHFTINYKQFSIVLLHSHPPNDIQYRSTHIHFEYPLTLSGVSLVSFIVFVQSFSDAGVALFIRAKPTLEL